MHLILHRACLHELQDVMEYSSVSLLARMRQRKDSSCAMNQLTRSDSKARRTVIKVISTAAGAISNIIGTPAVCPASRTILCSAFVSISCTGRRKGRLTILSGPMTVPVSAGEELLWLVARSLLSHPNLGVDMQVVQLTCRTDFTSVQDPTAHVKDRPSAYTHCSIVWDVV